MQSGFKKALSSSISNHIKLSKTRHETLECLAFLIMQHGSICLWRLAAYVSTQAQTESVQRRFYRFFQFVRLDGSAIARVVVEMLGLAGKPWTLAIDRTNWDFGKTTINILMISVIWNGMGIPLIWTLLPTAGNSNTQTRTCLLDRLFEIFPDLQIASLMGDREFIGDGWMAYLARRGIPFILRLRENQHVTRDGYEPQTIARIAKGLKRGDRMIPQRLVQAGAECQRGFAACAPRYNAIADRRASGPCLFRQAAPCAGGLPPPLDHRDYVRQSENEGIQHGGHAYHGSGQTLDPDGGAGAFRGDGCQNRRRGCAFETRSGQKTWPQGVIAVCSRPAYLAQNLRNSQSCSNIPFFKADVISKNAAKTSEIHGDMKGSLVRCCRP